MRQFILDENHGLVEVEIWKDGPNGERELDLSQLLLSAETLANDEKRRVAGELVGPYSVSTVFLGIDTSCDPDGPPVVFETMVFDRERAQAYRPVDGLTFRYCSWSDAEKGHAAVVAHLKETLEATSGEIESAIG